MTTHPIGPVKENDAVKPPTRHRPGGELTTQESTALPLSRGEAAADRIPEQGEDRRPRRQAMDRSTARRVRVRMRVTLGSSWIGGPELTVRAVAFDSIGCGS